MKVVRGMYKGRLGSSKPVKLTTDKVHAVNGETTFCRIDYRASEILGIAQDGTAAEVNCKRCLNAIAKL